MRAFVLFLLITLLVPRLGDDSSVHAAVCLNADTSSMDHAHMMHEPIEHQQIQQDGSDDCQHCGDCGVHLGTALSVNAQIAIDQIVSAPSIARGLVHAIARPSSLIRPPLA